MFRWPWRWQVGINRLLDRRDREPPLLAHHLPAGLSRHGLVGGLIQHRCDFIAEQFGVEVGVDRHRAQQILCHLQGGLLGHFRLVH